eukprot:6181149-Pleurochrysis_carterae.AAC.1
MSLAWALARSLVPLLSRSRALTRSLPRSLALCLARSLARPPVRFRACCLALKLNSALQLLANMKQHEWHLCRRFFFWSSLLISSSCSTL